MPNQLERLLNWLFQNPVIAFAIATAVVGAFRSMVKAASPKKPPTSPRAAPDRAGEDDLESRVRRNFEEMMRRRAAAPAPAAPVEAPAPRRKVVDYDEVVRAEPTSTEGPRGLRVEGAPIVRSAKRGATKDRSENLAAAEKAVAGTLKTAAAGRRAVRERLRDLRDVAFERRNLRRTMILREYLDPPVALRQ